MVAADTTPDGAEVSLPGGVVGPRYVGSGNSYANCVTFGRVAGASAVRLVSAMP